MLGVNVGDVQIYYFNNPLQIKEGSGLAESGLFSDGLSENWFNLYRSFQFLA